MLQVWSLIVLTVVACAVTYATIDKSVRADRKLRKSLLDGFYSSFLSFIQQSAGDLEKPCQQNQGARSSLMPARIRFFATNLGFFFIYTLYTCDLTAKMTVGVPAPVLTNFKDVIDNSLTVAYVKDGLEEALLSGAPQGSYASEVYLKHSAGVSDNEEMISEILGSSGKVVGFGPSDVTYLKPHLQFEDRVPMHVGFTFPKDSDLLEPFNYHILKLLESGVLKGIYHKWENSRAPPDNSERIFFGGTAEALGYSNFAFPALIFFLGLATASLLVCLEICTAYKGDRV